MCTSILFKPIVLYVNLCYTYRVVEQLKTQRS
jgi:hypothetical protein